MESSKSRRLSGKNVVPLVVKSFGGINATLMARLYRDKPKMLQSRAASRQAGNKKEEEKEGGFTNFDRA